MNNEKDSVDQRLKDFNEGKPTKLDGNLLDVMFEQTTQLLDDNTKLDEKKTWWKDIF